MTSLTPPSVEGIVRANELVTPVAGRWRGGWVGSLDQLQLAACATRSGRECTTLTHSHYLRSCPGGAAVLDPVFTGWFLRVADQRLGSRPIVALSYAVGSPYGHRVWRRDRITSVAVVGRIAPAAGPREDDCGPPPLAERP